MHPIKFDMGQLILAPFKGRDVLWTVIAVRKNGKATLLASFESYTVKVTTTTDELPDGWTLITQDEAVQALHVRRATEEMKAA